MNDKLREALIKDLDIQWRDHFHMRDQTWKTLTNSLLLFLGVVGLEIKGLGVSVMIPAYIVVIVTALFGMAVAAHHRSRQKQKFAMISLCEEQLGIAQYKKDILGQEDGLAGKLFTAGFIELVHFSIGVVAVALLIYTVAA